MNLREYELKDRMNWFKREAKRLAEAEGIDEHRALERVLTENPEKYREYDRLVTRRG